MEQYIPRLLDDYNKRIKNHLSEVLKISNPMRIPRLSKISLNIGFGEAKLNNNHLKAVVEELTNISGQKAVITKSKKAISNFKIREHDPVGVRVTLRSTNMYEFLDRFISVASPRIRDFRGLSPSGFDGQGNYNFGITEQTIFPEIDYDKIKIMHGMNISIVTTTKDDQEAYELLKSFGMPIKEVKKFSKLDNENEKEVVATEEVPTDETSQEEEPTIETLQDEASTEEDMHEAIPSEEASQEEASTEDNNDTFDENKDITNG